MKKNTNNMNANNLNEMKTRARMEAENNGELDENGLLRADSFEFQSEENWPEFDFSQIPDDYKPDTRN